MAENYLVTVTNKRTYVVEAASRGEALRDYSTSGTELPNWAFDEYSISEGAADASVYFFDEVE